ncbi:hypothetical protein [Siccirubricoccus phaeus]|uniref:hypothetical protein n=1 Tax=Siccirubricoccus phaeus TaxID=2595053 RepID=UPI00165BD615|nr:hypothetical protein [Siccirubricoccus phaeus]
MSGAALTLDRRRRDVIRPLLPSRSPAAWHAALVAEIAAGLGPAHAAVLAAPVEAAEELAWTAPGSRSRPFPDLPLADRRALTEALGAILSDIRRLGESGAAPAVAEAWPALREVPDFDALHAVDGRPVLTAWAHMPARAERPPGLLARFDDGRAWQAPPGFPWRPWALAGGALALLALAAGVLLPLLGAAMVPAQLPQCGLDPASLAIFQEAQREAGRQDSLEAELARLEEERGRRRIACPLPVQPPPPPERRAEAPTPPRPSEPPRRQELPQERWDRGDLAMLEGCWRNSADMTTIDPSTGQRNPLRAWRLCFDRDGNGRQELIWADGQRCEGPLRASFEGRRMHIAEPQRCQGGRGLYTGRQDCVRINDNEAECTRTELDGPRPGPKAPGRFRR